MDKEKLKEAYLYVFDCFAADTKEIAEYLDMSTKDTYNLLNSCGLLTGELFVDGMAGYGINRKNHPGVPYTWQCNETYDSISREEAIELFNQEYQ